MDVYSQVKNRLRALTLARKFDISRWFPSGADGRLDGRTGVGSHDYQNSRIDRLPNFLRYGAPLARASRARGAALLILPSLYNRKILH